MDVIETIKCANTEEWLKTRHGVVSSTESAALFGMSPYLTALELAVVKQAKEPTEFEVNERMVWGVRLQDSIAKGVSDDFGVLVYPMDNTFSRRKDVRMGASFDYLIVNEHRVASVEADETILQWFWEYGPGVLEIKNVDSLTFKNEWIDGESGGTEAPDHIEIQLQHQLQCTNFEWGAIAALVGGNRIELVIRKRDDKVGDGIRSAIEKFWNNLDAGVLPDPKWPSDAEIICKLYGYSKPGSVLDVGEGSVDHDPDVIKWCKEYKQAHETLTIAEEVKKTRKAMIMSRIRDAEKVIALPYKISASMVGPCKIAYDRAGYRDFRITQSKVKSGKDSGSK